MLAEPLLQSRLAAAEPQPAETLSKAAKASDTKRPTYLTSGGLHWVAYFATQAFHHPPYRYGSKLNHQRTTGFSPCFHLPGFHFGVTLFLTHSRISTFKAQTTNSKASETSRHPHLALREASSSSEPSTSLIRRFLSRRRCFHGSWIGWGTRG